MLFVRVAPVDIQEFQFMENNGNLLAGDVYHPMFDLAAVLKPKNPGKLAAGTKVGWVIGGATSWDAAPLADASLPWM